MEGRSLGSRIPPLLAVAEENRFFFLTTRPHAASSPEPSRTSGPSVDTLDPGRAGPHPDFPSFRVSVTLYSRPHPYSTMPSLSQKGRTLIERSRVPQTNVFDTQNGKSPIFWAGERLVPFPGVFHPKIKTVLMTPRTVLAVTATLPLPPDVLS